MGTASVLPNAAVRETTTFYFPTTIVFGAGAVAKLPELLSARGVRKPLLVTDRGLASNAITERVRSLLPKAEVFSAVDPNPTERNVLEGVDAYRRAGCDGIVGLGGGSALDAAKAMRLKVTHELPLAEYDDLLNGSDRIKPNLPVYIAIATTAGTGSEVSRSTVITVEASNRKTVIFSPHLMPTVAIADPELTISMPPAVTAGTGMDAFTHNLEAYLSQPYQPICDAIALSGVKLCWQNLPRVMRNGRDLEARGNMMIAAIMGAIAFQKGLGATHSLAHPLSSEAAMHHGTANAVMLPYVMEYNRPAVEARLRDLAVQMDAPPDAAAAIERVRELNRICGIAEHLSAFGISRDMLPKLADKAIQDGCHQLNPRRCEKKDLLAMYEAAL